MRVFEEALHMEEIVSNDLRLGSSAPREERHKTQRSSPSKTQPTTASIVGRTAAVAVKFKIMQEKKKRVAILVKLVNYTQTLLGRILTETEREGEHAGFVCMVLFFNALFPNLICTGLQKLTNEEVHALMFIPAQSTQQDEHNDHKDKNAIGIMGTDSLEREKLRLQRETVAAAAGCVAMLMVNLAAEGAQGLVLANLVQAVTKVQKANARRAAAVAAAHARQANTQTAIVVYSLIASLVARAGAAHAAVRTSKCVTQSTLNEARNVAAARYAVAAAKNARVMALKAASAAGWVVAVDDARRVAAIAVKDSWRVASGAAAVSAALAATLAGHAVTRHADRSGMCFRSS
jgi:hypothetical protein